MIVTTIGQLVEEKVLDKPLDGNHGSLHPVSSEYVERGIPFLLASDVRKGKIDLDNCKFISEKRANELQKGFAKEGDILLTHKGTVGEVAKVPKSNFPFVMLTPQVTYYRVLDKSKLNPDFLLQYFQSKQFQNELSRVSGGGTRAYVGITQQRKLKLVLPSIQNQERIAQILSTWDEAIEDVEELIEKKKRLRRTFLQTIVVGKKKIAEFKNSKWIAKSLSELGAIVSGGTPDTTQNEFWDGQIAWCTPTDITALKGKREISKTNRTITENGLKKSSANILPKNSIIVCTRATIGDAAMNTVPMATNQGFKSLVPNKANDSNYLYYLILTLKKTFIRFSSGSTFLELSKKDFAKTTVTIPESIEEQRKIAEIMIDIDEEIELLKTKRTMLMDQKRGLMQRLLTGKVRVK